MWFPYSPVPCIICPSPWSWGQCPDYNRCSVNTDWSGAECCPRTPQARRHADTAVASQDLVLVFKETAMWSLLNRCFWQVRKQHPASWLKAHFTVLQCTTFHLWVLVSRDGGWYTVLGDPESSGLGERPHGNWQNSTNQMNGVLKWLHTHTHTHTHNQTSLFLILQLLSKLWARLDSWSCSFLKVESNQFSEGR